MRQIIFPPAIPLHSVSDTTESRFRRTDLEGEADECEGKAVGEHDGREVSPREQSEVSTKPIAAEPQPAPAPGVI